MLSRLIGKAFSALVLCAFHLLAGNELDAATVAVRADGNGNYTSIQAAIDAARDGDVIVVSPGIYQENINFEGKAIMVRSSDPHDASVIARTVIEGGPAGPAVLFSGGENADSVLHGITVRGNEATLDRPAISCVGSKPTIENCRILAAGFRTAFHCQGARPTFSGCTVQLPHLERPQQVVSAVRSQATFASCVIVRDAGGGRFGQTYNLDGTTLAGLENVVELDPSMTDGAVFVRENDRRVETHPAPALQGKRGLRGTERREVRGEDMKPRTSEYDNIAKLWSTLGDRDWHALLASQAQPDRPWITGLSAWDPALFYAPYLRSPDWGAHSVPFSPIINPGMSDPALFNAPYLRHSDGGK